MRHAVIMAGGAGTRLWPLSRQSRPKQILRLFEGTSLLRQSFERVAAVVPPEQVYVITNNQHLPIVKEELPEVPEANLLGEPVGRDTANAIGLASAVVAERDRDATIGIFTADHIITPIERFAAAVNQSFEVAEQNADALVTMGIKPSRPDTNYGYIRRGEERGKDLFVAQKFTEKPGLAEAMKYISKGEYYWNSGMFAWRADTILAQIQKHLPQTFEAVSEIAKNWGTDEGTKLMEKLYPDLLRISIDFAVMEHAENVLLVEMDAHWVDVGSWPALESVISADSDGNVTACENTAYLGSRGNIVVSEDDHLIATIGVDDLVIVHSKDATLICTRRDASSIRELVQKVREKYDDRYA